MSESSSPVVNYALLDDFSLIKISGADTLEFLQSQLTQDVSFATTEQAQLTAWCNAKGRSLASFLFWQAAEVSDTYYFLIKKDILEPTLKRLKMFIFRNKVEIVELNATILGLWSEAKAVKFAPTEITDKHDFVVFQSDTQKQWISFPSTGSEQRYMAISIDQEVNGAAIDELLPQTDAYQRLASDASYWSAFDIIHAIAWVELGNREEFIPQGINYDAIGAVNFKKGCFPGQEVIARSHYRGTLKRRSYIGYTGQKALDVVVGADVFQDDSPTGKVVNIAHLPDDKGSWVLFETRLEAVDGSTSESLHLGSESGPELRVQAPPYSLEKPEN